MLEDRLAPAHGTLTPPAFDLVGTPAHGQFHLCSAEVAPLTPSVNDANGLANPCAAVLPGQTATAALPGFAVTLMHHADAAQVARIYLAISGSGETYELRTFGVDARDELHLVFALHGPGQSLPTIEYIDPATGSRLPLRPSSRYTESFDYDPAYETLTIVLDDSSTPSPASSSEVFFVLTPAGGLTTTPPAETIDSSALWLAGDSLPFRGIAGQGSLAPFGLSAEPAVIWDAHGVADEPDAEDEMEEILAESYSVYWQTAETGGETEATEAEATPAAPQPLPEPESATPEENVPEPAPERHGQPDDLMAHVYEAAGARPRQRAASRAPLRAAWELKAVMPSADRETLAADLLHHSRPGHAVLAFLLLGWSFRQPAAEDFEHESNETGSGPRRQRRRQGVKVAILEKTRSRAPPWAGRTPVWRC